MLLAEAVRFELTDPCESLVFKTRAIDHSTTLPRLLERAAGIEPATCPWQGYVLPLAPCPLILAESVGVEPTQRLITIVGLAIRCLPIRPTLQCCYYIAKFKTSQSKSGTASSLRAVRFNTRSPPVTYLDDD